MEVILQILGEEKKEKPNINWEDFRKGMGERESLKEHGLKQVT